MKKNIKDEAPKTPEQPASNVRSYFTKEINDQIVEMTTKEMESVMKEMISSRQWIALLKYTAMRTPILDATLRSTNPVKDPSSISWAQGAMAGLCDIENYVIDLNAPKKEQAEEQEEQPRGAEGMVG
jgi:hypothetical protein